jgi:hypothetical protein
VQTVKPTFKVPLSTAAQQKTEENHQQGKFGNEITEPECRVTGQ